MLGRAKDALRWLFWGSRVLVRGTLDLVSLVRGGELGDAIEPWMRVDYAEDIPFEQVAAGGAKAVLFDLENTLVPPGGPLTQDGRDILGKARAAGLEIAVVSNASASWVGDAMRSEGIPFVAPAGKPAKEAFVAACRVVGVTPAQAVYVGDQVITDVLGSQRAGLRAILVTPKYTKEFKSAKFQRLVARAVIRLAKGKKRNL